MVLYLIDFYIIFLFFQNIHQFKFIIIFEQTLNLLFIKLL